MRWARTVCQWRATITCISGDLYEREHATERIEMEVQQEPDYHKWMKRPQWTLFQAVYLLALREEPPQFPDQSCLIAVLTAGISGDMYADLKGAVSRQWIQSWPGLAPANHGIRIDPAECATWISQQGYVIPPVVSELVFKAGLPPEEAGQTNAIFASSTSEWKGKAQNIAREYIARHKAQDLFPSQKDVSEHVAAVLREKKIYGPQNKPISANYIERNVLRGEWWRKNKP